MVVKSPFYHIFKALLQTNVLSKRWVAPQRRPPSTAPPLKAAPRAAPTAPRPRSRSVRSAELPWRSGKGRWMEKILHQLISELSYYLWGFNMFQPSKVMQDLATIQSISYHFMTYTMTAHIIWSYFMKVWNSYCCHTRSVCWCFLMILVEKRISRAIWINYDKFMSW